jgi:hypothetical protein
MKSILILVMALLLASCAAQKNWHKEGATGDQFDRDKSECVVKAYQAVPFTPIQAAPTKVTGYDTNCQGNQQNLNCKTTTQTAPSGGLMDSYYLAEANAAQLKARDAALASCLYNKGYNLK